MKINKKILNKLLDAPDIQVYTCVQLARKSIKLENNYIKAMAFLRVDADKLRMHSEELYKIIKR